MIICVRNQANQWKRLFRIGFQKYGNRVYFLVLDKMLSYRNFWANLNESSAPHDFFRSCRIIDFMCADKTLQFSHNNTIGIC